jgi:hypothetical protein
MKTANFFSCLIGAVLVTGCASTTLDVSARDVRGEAEELVWRAATQAEIAGHWRLRSVDGPAAAVLMDIAYWLDPDGSFTGAALFMGPPPSYEVLAGSWSLDASGMLVLGEEAEPASVEIAGELLKLAGADGSLVLERAEIQ